MAFDFPCLRKLMAFALSVRCLSAASLDLTKIEQLGSFGFVHDFVFPVWFLLTALTFVCLEIRMQYRRYFTKGSAEMLGESVRLPLLRLLFALRYSIFRVFDSRIFRVFGCSVRLFGSLVVDYVLLFFLYGAPLGLLPHPLESTTVCIDEHEPCKHGTSASAR